MRYFLLNTMPVEDENWCFFDRPPTRIEMTGYKLARGIAMSAEYPADVRLYMEQANPGVELPDLVGNTRGLLICSKLLKESIEPVQGAPTEYLPVALYDHERRRASSDYYFLNPLGSVNCLDLDRCELRRRGNDIVSIQSFVLDPAKLKDVPDLFRIREELHRYVFSEKLARALVPRNPTNLYFEELEIAS